MSVTLYRVAMNDSTKLALVAIAAERGLGMDEAWELVDRLAEDATDLRSLSREIAQAAERAAWGGQDVRSVN